MNTKLFFVFLFLVVAPLFAHAAPIVPCGADDFNNDGMIKDLPGARVEECHFDDFIVGINNIINFLIVIGGSVAAIVFAIAGFMILTAGANESQVTKAKGMFMQVVWGFVWMLSAWLVVKMVLVGLGVTDAFSFLG